MIAFLGIGVLLSALYPKFCLCDNPLNGFDRLKLIWDSDCEQAFLALKKALVQPPVLAYPTNKGPFILSMDASDTGMGTVLEQGQEEDGKVVKRFIAYASKTLNSSQQRYCTTSKW